MLLFPSLPSGVRLRSQSFSPSSLISLISLLVVFCTLSPHVHAAQVELAWNPNDEPDLAGYRVYYANSGDNYDCCVDVGNQTSCVVSGLTEGAIYRFVATAYDGNGNESGFSNEVSYLVPESGPGNQAPVAQDDTVTTTQDVAVSGVLRATDSDGDALTYSIVTHGSLGTVRVTDPTTGAYVYTPNPNVTGSDSFRFQANDGALDSNMATVTVLIEPKPDTDGDGIVDVDERDVYGTDPNQADTDRDGINDGDEVASWGKHWNADYDADGVINVLDPDADGDGYADGIELDQGWDPSDPGSPPPQAKWSDYRIDVTIQSSDNDAMGVMFRYQDPHNYYRFSWNRQRRYRRLVKCEKGAFTLLAEDKVRYTQRRIYQIEIAAQGSNLEVRVDGKLIFSVTDQSFASGAIALYCWANRGSHFDDVYVEDLQTGKVLLSEDFSHGACSGWGVIDEGTKYAPSAWFLTNGALVQKSNIYSSPTNSGDLRKFGTYVLYEAQGAN